MKTINPEVKNPYIDFIDDLLIRQRVYQGNIISRLQAVQDYYHYLPRQALQYLAAKSSLEENHLLSIATFYKQFRLVPAGAHIVRVCVGTACHVKGAESIFQSFKDSLDIKDEDDTDAGKRFTVVKTACLGCCMLAPAVQIDQRTYAYVSPEKSGSILEGFLRESSLKKKPFTPYIPRQHKAEILICRCSSCMAAGSSNIEESIKKTIKRYKLDLKIKDVGCTGFSYKAPYFEIHSPKRLPIKIANAREDQIESILLSYLGESGLKTKSLYYFNHLVDYFIDPQNAFSFEDHKSEDDDYIRRQKQLATEHAGLADPLSLQEYQDIGGLRALQTCLKQNNPRAVIQKIKGSGLRGRGGGGFPTAQKWQKILDAEENPRYLICNADEGDPGAFMDRLLLESFPFRVLEGILIASRTLSVETALIYVRAEYPLAAARIKEALRLFQQEGLLDQSGRKGQTLKVEVIEGAGAFVCGEESALIKAVQGERGIPASRPPYPAEKGLWGKPTLINNVETFALIPWLLRSPEEGFGKLGTQNSRGTKTFALAGKIKRSGLIEVPMGMSIREIVEKIGGGMQEGSIFKAVQIGGPAGGCIPASLSDSLIDYDSLKELGAIMGSGGMVVLDQQDCLVELARYFMEFAVNESCGLCLYCRVGCQRMLEMLEQLVAGKANPRSLEQLEKTAELVRKRSKCGLGRGSVNPFLSGLKHFRPEYEAHLEGRCPAGQCKELIHFQVDPEKCIGCTKCAQVCPAGAILARPYQSQYIDDSQCVKCGSCVKICPEGAIHVH